LTVITFLAHFLFVLAGWTVVVKFLFPMAYALAHGAPVTEHIYWDFWWVIHLWLGWSLLNWKPYTFALAVGVSVIEITIIATKFVLFFQQPEWTIWSTNWFINKIFVLACFLLMLVYFVKERARLRTDPSMSASRTPEARAGT
jgi:hypothetical protein